MSLSQVRVHSSLLIFANKVPHDVTFKGTDTIVSEKLPYLEVTVSLARFEGLLQLLLGQFVAELPTQINL